MAPKRPPGKKPSLASAATAIRASSKLARGSGLPLSLADNAPSLLEQAAHENKQDVVRRAKENAPRLQAIYEAVLKLPVKEGTSRLQVLDEAQEAFDLIQQREALECCQVAEVLHRRNIAAQETSDKAVIEVEAATRSAAILAEQFRREEEARQLQKKKLVTRVLPGGGLNGRVLRRKLQADVELQKKEATGVEEIRRLDSSALAKKNAEDARAERRGQLEVLKEELKKLVHEPATKETSPGDIQRLAEVTFRRVQVVQKESLANAKKKDGRGDCRTSWEKDRDALITAIEQRIRKIEEMDDRAAFREEEERQRIERAKKLKGIDLAVLTGEKSVLEIHHKRELELAQMEADEAVDEILFRQMTNATGKEFHEQIKEHEKAFLKLNKKMEALHGGGGGGGGGGGNKSPNRLPDINANKGWNIQSPRRGLGGFFSVI